MDRCYVYWIPSAFFNSFKSAHDDSTVAGSLTEGCKAGSAGGSLWEFPSFGPPERVPHPGKHMMMAL